MKFICSIIFLSYCLSLYGQQSTTCPEESKEFIQDVLGKYFDIEKMLVTDALDSFSVATIKEKLGDGRFRKEIIFEDKTSRVDTLVLSPDELAFIGQELKNQQHDWLTSCFPTTRLISKHSADSIYSTSIYRLHSISRPIFLRNNSLCLFYSDYACGPLCGGGSLSFYKKENGKWRHYWGLSLWHS
jgi:hypothetical protein